MFVVGLLTLPAAVVVAAAAAAVATGALEGAAGEALAAIGCQLRGGAFRSRVAFFVLSLLRSGSAEAVVLSVG